MSKEKEQHCGRPESDTPSSASPPPRDKKTAFIAVSPQGWHLQSSLEYEGSPLLDCLGLSKADLEERAYRNTFDWLVRHFDTEEGAFHGYYDTRSREFALPQTVNLIAPFQLLAAYDRHGDDELLQMSRRCSDWLENNMVENHPMSLVLGGGRDNIKPEQLWTKYTADYVILNLALFERSGDEEVVRRAVRGSKFLLQSQNHQFAPKYDHALERWVSHGWQSFGRVVVAMIALEDVLDVEEWLDRATVWAEYGTELQDNDGCLRLINGTYYSSDIAADEIRALIRCFWRTNRRKYRTAAIRFADWHVQNQLPNGAWPLSIDRWGVTVGEYIGPGDVPNIAISMLLMHKAIGDLRYLVTAVRALRYSLSQQLVPWQDEPVGADPNALWGFWSWDPRYDWTMSPDQSTHHVRGFWFFLDYFYSLDSSVQEQLVEAVEAADAEC